MSPDETVSLEFSHVTVRNELNGLEQANIQQGLLWLYRQRGTMS